MKLILTILFYSNPHTQEAKGGGEPPQLPSSSNVWKCHVLNRHHLNPQKHTFYMHTAIGRHATVWVDAAAADALFAVSRLPNTVRKFSPRCVWAAMLDILNLVAGTFLRRRLATGDIKYWDVPGRPRPSRRERWERKSGTKTRPAKKLIRMN